MRCFACASGRKVADGNDGHTKCDGREELRVIKPVSQPHQRPIQDGERVEEQAHYRELRSKPVVTVVGKVEVTRPYYLCSHCHAGQFPADGELDIENTELSPGVRRMQAVVGQAVSFDHGRQQMKLLAGLDVTTKAVERTAEAIGEDIAAREQKQIQRAVQLDLPIIVGEPLPILYVQMDGTGVPVVKKETVGEIAAAAQVMREFATRVEVADPESLLDVVGTGGDASQTFNISTAAMFT